MKLIYRVFGPIILLVILSGCATSVRLASTPNVGQEIEYNSGIECIISKKENGAVGIQFNPLTQLTNGMIGIYLAAYNNLDTPSVISCENVRASCDGKDLKVHSPEDIVETMERKRKTALVLMALGGGLQASAAYNAAANRSYSGTVYGPGYTATYSGTVHDPAAGMQAQAASNAMTAQQMDMINADSIRKMQAVSSDALKKHTLQPGQSYGGTIFLDSGGYSSEKRRLTLYVAFNGETHSFQIDARN